MISKFIPLSTLVVDRGKEDYINIDHIVRIEQMYCAETGEKSCTRIWYSYCGVRSSSVVDFRHDYDISDNDKQYYTSKLLASEVMALLWGYEGNIDEKDKTSNSIHT